MQFNYSSEPLRVLEIFAPPPSQGTAGTYARTKTYLAESKYVQQEWLGKWPMSQREAEAGHSMRVIRDADLLWTLVGDRSRILCGLYASTEHLTVGKMSLQPGQKSDVQHHDGDESLYVLDGTLNIRLPESQGPSWFELQPRDGFYIPADVPHQYYNVSGSPVNLLFGVAPNY
jgi:quercetin dioxygenase-like cupin family protein